MAHIERTEEEYEAQRNVRFKLAQASADCIKYLSLAYFEPEETAEIEAITKRLDSLASTAIRRELGLKP